MLCQLRFRSQLMPRAFARLAVDNIGNGLPEAIYLLSAGFLRADGSGAPRGTENAIKHGLYTREAIAQRQQLADAAVAQAAVKVE